jgi:hypothetical protein
MSFAYGEDGMFRVHADAAKARRQWEPIDVENGVVVCYAEDGAWLKPEFTRPNRRSLFGPVLTQGDYVLVKTNTKPVGHDPIDVALDEAGDVEPHPEFDSVAAIGRHVQEHANRRQRTQSIDNLRCWDCGAVP